MLKNMDALKLDRLELLLISKLLLFMNLEVILMPMLIM